MSEQKIKILERALRGRKKVENKLKQFLNKNHLSCSKLIKNWNLPIK